MRLREALQESSLGLLRAIAREYGVEIGAASLARELVEHLVATLTQPGRLRLAIESLEPRDRHLLALVARSGGEMAGIRARRLAQFSAVESGGELDRSLRLLQSRGLLFRRFRADPRPGEWLVLPLEVREALPGGDGGEALPPAVGESPDEITPSADPVFDLLGLAALLRERGGVLSAESLVLLPHGSVLADERRHERWRLLTWLGLRLGWFARRGRSVLPTPAFATALRQGHAAHARLWQTYLTQAGWRDAGWPAEQQEGGTLALGRRQAIAASLGDLEGRWYSLDALSAWVLDRLPGLFRTSVGDQPGPRERQAALRSILSGPFTWLGVLQAGVWREAQVARVSEVGLSLLRERPIASRGDGAVALTAGGVLELGRRPNLYHLYGLLPYLETGDWSTFRLSRGSFVAGLARGGSVAEALFHLAGLCGGLPEGWARTLRDWERHATGGRLESVWLLDLRKHPDAQHLLADPQVRECLERTLGEREALVRAEARERLRRRLRELGLLLEQRRLRPRKPRHAEAEGER